MPLAFYAALLTLAAIAQVAAFEREPVEGTIALTRFGGRFEIVGGFLIQGGADNLVPLRVPEGKRLMLRQVTATCTIAGGTYMNFWTIRSSPEAQVHHYLPMKRAGRDSYAWVASERVQIPVRAGGRPVATFQKSAAYGLTNEACVGSWAGYFEDAPPR